MLQFDTLTLDSHSPIYLQILRFIKQGIASGTICYGDELPSRRVLSALLGVNPNTVQKAYAALEREGILYSVTGKGDFVADNAARIKEMRKQEIREMFQRVTREARDSGLWIDEIFSIVDEGYSEG